MSANNSDGVLRFTAEANVERHHAGAVASSSGIGKTYKVLETVNFLLSYSSQFP